MVCPSGAKRAERMLPRRNVSCRYMRRRWRRLEKSILPPYKPAARAANEQIATERATSSSQLWSLRPERRDGPDSAEARMSGAPRCARIGRAGLGDNRSARRVERALQPLQVGAQFGGALAAHVAVFFQGLADCLFELCRKLGRSRRRVGARLRIASVMTAEVSPRKGTTPVAIS